jgi:hypothetical protein
MFRENRKKKRHAQSAKSVEERREEVEVGSNGMSRRPVSALEPGMAAQKLTTSGVGPPLVWRYGGEPISHNAIPLSFHAD